MSSSMTPSLWQAARQGSVLITVNRRLARELLDNYADYQQQAGLSVWQTPAIYPLDEWLERSLQQVGCAQVLLNPQQTAVLWEQVIREDLRGRDYDLLQLSMTVRQAMQAHRLCCDYRVGDFDGYSEEQQAFLRWRQAVAQRCQDQGWLDRANLIEQVGVAIDDALLSFDHPLFWLGFDDLNPAQQLLCERIRQHGGVVTVEMAAAGEAGQTVAYAAVDESMELQAAAQWARRQLEQQVGRVAVVVPDLTRLQHQVERVFRAELRRSSWPDRVGAETFNVSLGTPLADQGMVTAAFSLLSLEREIEFEQLSYLLRSPWFVGGQSEAALRARFERRLRQLNVRQISWPALSRLLEHSADAPPGFKTLVVRMQSFIQQRREAAPAHWCQAIDQLLSDVGWPGERPLDSDSYQVVAAWNQKLLPTLASLGGVLPQMARQEAVARLRQLATELLFQPKAVDQRLQIVGLLETAGLQFDALWLSGMTDQVLPGAVEFNPFLPVPLQRHYAMPHSSIQHEHAYARHTLQRLLVAAAEVVVSYPASQQQTESRCSPFVAERLKIQPLAPVATVALPTDVLEAVPDDQGAPVDLSEQQGPIKGGTGVLKEQVQCPFRAYAHHRLAARSLDVPQAGLTSRCRGELTHLVLQRIWSGLHHSQALHQLEQEELRQRVETVVDQVLDDYRFAEHERPFLAGERLRLQQLTLEWLELEKGREPFEVVTVEQRQQLQVGPLTLTAIPDRIDRLHGGGQLVLDYKTGLVSTADLLGEHLLEPQLPIYALEQGGDQVVGVTFAQVRHGECRFKGVAAEDGLLPGVKGVDKSGAAKRGVSEWPQLLADWRQQLLQSADDFVAGRAAVQPVANKVCQYCDLTALCRIHAADALEEEDDD